MKYLFSFILFKCIQTIMQSAASVQRGQYWDSDRQFLHFIALFPLFQKKKTKR